MSDLSQQIINIEEEIRKTPKHKATEHYIGHLRAKLARLNDRVEEQKSRKTGGNSEGYAVKKQGDATVILVGPPSVGKSTLLNTLTNAQSKVAPYEFTTLKVIPGMMEYRDARIQILDVPGLIAGAEEGRGRGREVLSVARGTDLIIIMVDFEKIDDIEKIKETLEKNGIRINQSKPEVNIDKKLSGGIIIHSNIKQDFPNQTIKDIAQEMGVKNAEVTIKEKLSINRLIDSFSKNRVYLPAITVINKIDLYKDIKTLRTRRLDYGTKDIIYISAKENQGINKIKEKIWENLNLVRIYLIKKDQQPSQNNPLIVKSNLNLKDVSQKIGEEFSENVKGAKIWGTGAKYSGQEVSLSTKVLDGMQVRFI